MKKWILSLLLLYTFNCRAQLWRPIVQSDTLYYSTQIPAGNFDSKWDGYTRSVSVDSMISILPFEEYYFPYTVRMNQYNMLDTLTGDSWLGPTCSFNTNNGEAIFLNQYRDTILLKTWSSIGDSWNLLTDSNGVNIKATLLTVGTINIDQITDSIKIISLQAYQGSNPIAHWYNGFNITLSKDHGFYAVPEFYTFPYVDSVSDPWLSTYPYPKLARIFKRIDKDKVQTDVNAIDWAWKYQTANEWMVSGVSNWILFFDGHDSIINPVTIFSDSIIVNHYHHEIHIEVDNGPPPVFSQVQTMGASVDTIKYFLSGQDVRLRNYGILEPRVMFDMPSIMLEQPFVFTKIICDSLFWIKDSLNWSHSLSGYGSKSNNYLQKFGLFGNYYEINAVGSDKHSFQINYAKLGSCILGVKYWFAPDAVSEVNEAMEKIVIYPNPANQEIRLTTSSRKGTVVIRNLMGQIILQSELKSSIPLGQIPNGIYTIQFITKDGIQSDKLMIQ